MDVLVCVSDNVLDRGRFWKEKRLRKSHHVNTKSNPTSQEMKNRSLENGRFLCYSKVNSILFVIQLIANNFNFRIFFVVCYSKRLRFFPVFVSCYREV